MSAEIGKYCTIKDDVVFGEGCKVFGYANLYGCSFGDGCRIGPFTEVQSDVKVGARVRIQSHTFICSDVVIGDEVFIGHHVCFINDRYPTAKKAGEKIWKQEGIRVGNGVSIGSGATILCGLEIGQGAVIGAGSVVTRDVPPHTVVAGNPAKIIREIPENERWLGGQSARDREENGG